jgi:hypothetical protein
VSREDEGAIQKVFVDELGAKYPIVKIKAGDSSPYGITGYPSAYVLAPDGTVVSTPSDGMPGDAQIEELLKTVSLAPKMPADKHYDPLRALWKKAEFLKVRDYLDKSLAAPNLDPAMKDVFTAQRAEFDKRLAAATARVTTLGQGPDYAEAEDKLDKIEKQWKGLEPATAAATEKARFLADAAIKKELTAGRALQKVVAAHDISKVAQRKKLGDALMAFSKKYEGTYAGKQATEQITRLAQMR